MLSTLKWAETSPAAQGTAASSVAITGSSGAAGIASLSPVGLEQFESLSFYAALVGATGGTLDVYVQSSPDGGATWIDFAHFPQLAAGAAAVKYRFTVSRGGQLLVPTVVGINASPALAANTVVGGDWDDRLRLVMVAGASTTAGAAVSVFVTATKN